MAVGGYWYSLGIHMGVCRGPVDEIVEIKIADKRAWPLEYTITENKPVYTGTPDGTTGWDNTGGVFVPDPAGG